VVTRVDGDKERARLACPDFRGRPAPPFFLSGISRGEIKWNKKSGSGRPISAATRINGRFVRDVPPSTLRAMFHRREAERERKACSAIGRVTDDRAVMRTTRLPSDLQVDQRSTSDVDTARFVGERSGDPQNSSDTSRYSRRGSARSYSVGFLAESSKE